MNLKFKNIRLDVIKYISLNFRFIRWPSGKNLRKAEGHDRGVYQTGLLDERTLWFNSDHLFHDCCDHDLPKIFTSPTHCDLSNITYILLYSGSFQKKNIKNKSAFRLWPRHRSLPIHSGNFFWLDFEKISWVKEFFLENYVTGLNESGFFKYLKQKSNNYSYWFTLKWVKVCILTWTLDIQLQY